jgi:membrane-associated phospholipid phosphatase
MQSLLNWDYRIFRLIHVQAQHAALDFIAPYLRNQYFWAPVYIFLLILVYQQYGKKALVWALWLLVTFAFSDFISASILKPLFGRVRPCMDPMWYEQIRHIVPVSKGPSFPSSHATNHFGMSLFIGLTLKHYVKNIWFWVIAWASLVSLAQIYCGMHYPLDIIAGALLGTWVGYITGNYFNLRSHL